MEGIRITELMKGSRECSMYLLYLSAMNNDIPRRIRNRRRSLSRSTISLLSSLFLGVVLMILPLQMNNPLWRLIRGHLFYL
jgi:hypothetical protein